MNLDLINPYVIKILISARKEDSIRAIAKRIDLSYGWTYRWAQELIKLEVFKKKGQGIALQENSSFFKDTLKYIKEAFAKDTSFHYSILELFGIKYCFAETDAVFVWTKGGYNIARHKGRYPIFIKVKKADKSLFDYYVQKLGLKGKIFYSAKFLDDFKIEYCDGIPVDPLRETVKFMKKYIYNFQPALEMIQETYGKKLGIKYREAVLNV